MTLVKRFIARKDRHLMAVNVEHRGHVDADCLLPTNPCIGTDLPTVLRIVLRTGLATAWQHVDTSTAIHQTVGRPLQQNCSSNLNKEFK